MAPLDAESQFKFLISCIKHSTSGKVDFAAVASDQGIVSKGAASKRYERLLKNNGIDKNGGPSAPKTPKTPTKPRTPLPNGRPSAKKRKVVDTSDVDDDEPDVKTEVKTEVKEEASDDLSHTHNKSDGSYMSDLNDPPLAATAAAATLVTMAGDVRKSDGALGGSDGADDDVQLISATQRTSSSMPSLLQQVFMRPPDSYYGLDQSQLALHHRQHSQASAAMMNAAGPMTYECDTNYPSQTISAPTDFTNTSHNWHHQQQDPVYFWSEMSRMGTPDDVRHT